MIWKHAMPDPCKIVLSFPAPQHKNREKIDGKWGVPTPPDAPYSLTRLSPVPALLHVFVEARIEALKSYRLGFGGDDDYSRPQCLNDLSD